MLRGYPPALCRKATSRDAGTFRRILCESLLPCSLYPFGTLRRKHFVERPPDKIRFLPTRTSAVALHNRLFIARAFLRVIPATRTLCGYPPDSPSFVERHLPNSVSECLPVFYLVDNDSGIPSAKHLQHPLRSICSVIARTMFVSELHKQPPTLDAISPSSASLGHNG